MYYLVSVDNGGEVWYVTAMRDSEGNVMGYEVTDRYDDPECCFQTLEGAMDAAMVMDHYDSLLVEKILD